MSGHDTSHNKMPLPKVVSKEEWKKARFALLEKEKEATKIHDDLAAERRRLPMVKIEKEYRFEGMLGEFSLSGLFDGRPQLVVYHFMYHAQKKSFCNGCCMMVDNMGHPAHLHARGVSRALITRAPLDELIQFQQRMAWRERMFSSAKSDFNDDFGVSTPKGEVFGLSVFLKDGDDIYLTYFTDGRGGGTPRQQLHLPRPRTVRATRAMGGFS